MPSTLTFRRSVPCLLAALVACADPDAPAPDAGPPSQIPTSPAGTFALTSELSLRVPAIAGPVVASLTAATDGPDDPTRFIVDRMVDTLPDGAIKTLAHQLAPYIAAYLQARLGELAPRLAPGLAAITGGLVRIASHLETEETLAVDRDGAAIRTITAARYQLGGAPVVVRLADAGLADLAAATRVSLDRSGRLALADHRHRVPYGALLRLGLDRAIAPAVVPGARDLAAALAALVDCDRLGGVVAERVGLGGAALYAGACRTALAALASELAARLGAIDEVGVAFDVTGSADGVDTDGDGAMDQLRAGRWTGSVMAGTAREPLDAGAFAGGQVTRRASAPGSP